jgi:THO complex subunit 4
MFIIYNNQARSKGMALVTFHRPADAGVARAKYNGKVIDGSTSFSAISLLPLTRRHHN